MMEEKQEREEPLEENSFLYAEDPVKNTETETDIEPERKRRPGLLILEAVALLLLVPVLCLFFLYKDTNPVAVVEMTGELPAASVFSKNGLEAEYRMDTSGIHYYEPGRTLVKVAVSGKSRLCLLILEDTTPPSADFKHLTVGAGETVTADKCIENLKDARPVAVSFAVKPQFGVTGTQEITVKLMDISGNFAYVSGPITVRALKEDSIIVEAGESVPDAETLVYHPGDAASYVTDVDKIDMSSPGEHLLEIDVLGTVYPCGLTVADTVAPVVETKTLFIKPGETVSAEDFVDTASDATALSFSFVREPDYESRDIQHLEIRTVDLGGNETVSDCELMISPLPPITVEASKSFLKAEALGEDVKINAHLRLNKTGTFKVKCTVSDEECYALVTVADTVPPVIKAKDTEGYLHVRTDPKSLIVSAEDMTDLSYSFKTDPDFDSEEPQTVTVLVTDGGGNTVEATAVLLLTRDVVPPSIYCPETVYCYIGETVSYFAEVAATDDRGGEVDIAVDTSNVNIYEAGSYLVTYTATDMAGNTATGTSKFVFMQPGVTEQAYEDAVERLYNKIVTPGMDLKHQGKAIFDYVYKHLTYHARSNKKDWRYEAYRGITYKTGDCFTFCAVARALLEKAGAKIMVVTREGGWANTHHWWLLVDLGTGYYHFDPINVGPKNYKCFMKTDAEVKKKNRMFWAFDKKKYPATPTVPFSLD